MNRLRPRILASFAVAILVLVTGWAGAGAISSGLYSREQALHGRRALDALTLLEHQLRSAESSQRGYLLTGSPSYLEVYRSVVQSGDLLAPAVAAFAGDDDAAPLLLQLTQNVNTKLAELAETIRLYDHGERAASLALVTSNRGKLLMDAIGDNLTELAAFQRHLQEGYITKLVRTFRLARAVILGGTLLSFALAVLVNLSLVSTFRQREEAKKLVEAQAVQLGQVNAALLKHERSLADQLDKEKRLGEALGRSNEELDQFAYATSHDLKAPLRGIINLAGWIEEDLGPELPAKVKQHLDLLRNRARRLQALIEGILAYSRAGRVRSKHERVDTAALVAEVIELIAPPDNVQIDAGALPVVTTERVPLQQVFMNLLQNAIKHGCPNGGTIRIFAEEDAQAWTFSVKDGGPGIAPQFQERVFGIFQTLSPRDRVEGAGIGLAVVKKLVESRGGSVTLDSQPGAGATFRVRWPKGSHLA